MSRMEPSIDPAQLLEHAGWMKHLARSLVGEDQAEDVVQQVWLAGLQRPPSPGRGLRSWLAAVVRKNAAKLRRTEARQW